jgi:hypothetical protein
VTKPEPSPRTSEYGRIRLFEHTSDMVLRLLFQERNRLAMARRDRPSGTPTKPWNHQIEVIDQVIDEVRRMRTEKGWSPNYTPAER